MYHVLIPWFYQVPDNQRPVAGSAKLINYDSTALKVACTVVILAIGFVAFRFTKFGTYLKAIGAGEKAAMFSGIRTDRMKFLIYVLQVPLQDLQHLSMLSKSDR